MNTDRVTLFIDGQRTDGCTPEIIEVIEAATEQPFGSASVATAADVDRGATAARRALDCPFADVDNAAVIARE